MATRVSPALTHSPELVPVTGRVPLEPWLTLAAATAHGPVATLRVVVVSYTEPDVACTVY